MLTHEVAKPMHMPARLHSFCGGCHVFDRLHWLLKGALLGVSRRRDIIAV